MEIKRCAVHGLIAGPDGRCVICRRGEAETTPATSSDLPAVVLFAAFALATILAVGAFFYLKIRRDSEAEAARLQQQQATLAVEPAATTNPDVPQPRPVVTRSEWPDDPAPSALPQPVDPEQLAAERLLDAKRQVPIKLYGAKQCMLCDRARAHLLEREYRVAEFSVDSSSTDMVLLKTVNPQGTVPTFDIDGKVLVGYDANVLEKAIEAAAKRHLKE